MTPEQATGLLRFIEPQLSQEFDITRRVLAAVPDDKADYRPHPTNMAAGELAQHIALSEIWFLESVLKGEFSEPDDMKPTEMKPGEIASLYEARLPGLIQQLNGLSGEQLARDVKFFTFNLPLVVYLQFAQKHTIHHRGQLSAYLRPMGCKVPCIYGGSADEPMTAATQA